jgi:hypothetical protein
VPEQAPDGVVAHDRAAHITCDVRRAGGRGLPSSLVVDDTLCD